MSNLKKILLIHVSGRVGDSLLATPAIQAVAEYYPHAQIDLLAHRNRLELFKNNPRVNLIGAISTKRARWRGWSCSKIYDLVIVFNYHDPMVSIVNYATRVGKKVVAYDTVSSAVNKKLTVTLTRQMENEHAVDGYLNLVSALNIEPQSKRIRFFPTDDELFNADEILKPYISQYLLVGYQVASFPTRSFRDWPPEFFIELSQRMLAVNPNTFFLLFGGQEEVAKINLIKQSLGVKHCLDLSGLSLRLTAAIMSKINLYVGVDTGPTHMMSAFNIPFVGLYHGKFPSSLYGPLRHPHSQLIDHPLGIMCNQNSSMADISVNDVFEAVLKVLNNE